MKASEYIKEYGDFEITEDIEMCIPCSSKNVYDLQYTRVDMKNYECEYRKDKK